MTYTSLTQSMYVDDVITGGETENEVLSIYSEAKHIFRNGGFNLRKFWTNSTVLQKQIDEKEGPVSA